MAYNIQKRNYALDNTPKLDTENLKKLEKAILEAKIQQTLRENVDLKSKQFVIEYGIWLRLKKIKVTGAQLATETQTKLDKLSQLHPEWKLKENQEEEFSYWIERDNGSINQKKPYPCKQLVPWLKENQKYSFDGDNWENRCHENMPITACTLIQLEKENNWYPDRWQEAFYVWANTPRLSKITWEHLAHILIEAPDDFLNSVASALSD